MDRIEKALKKLTTKERAWAWDIFGQLYSGKTEGLNIKKLKGRDDIFRVRKGGIRILYRTERGHIFILAIERRREDTYKFLRAGTQAVNGDAL